MARICGASFFKQNIVRVTQPEEVEKAQSLKGNLRTVRAKNFAKGAGIVGHAQGGVKAPLNFTTKKSGAAQTKTSVPKPYTLGFVATRA